MEQLLAGIRGFAIWNGQQKVNASCAQAAAELQYESEERRGRRSGCIACSSPDIEHVVSYQDVISSSVAAIVLYICDSPVKLDSASFIPACEIGDNRFARIQNKQYGCKILTVFRSQYLVVSVR